MIRSRISFLEPLAYSRFSGIPDISPKVTNLFSRGAHGGLEQPWNPFRAQGGKSSRAAQAPFSHRKQKKQSHDLQCDFAIMHRGVDIFLQCQSNPSCDMNMYYATPCKIAILPACTNKVYMHYDSVCILQTNARP